MRIVLIILYPLLVHASIVYKLPYLTGLAFFSLSTATLLDGLIRKSVTTWVAYLLLNILILLLSFTSKAIYLSFLPPVLMPMVLFWIFFSSLLFGNEPVITGIAESAHGPLTKAMRAYTRRITVLWAFLTGLIAISAIFLPVFSSLETWSLCTNFINYILCGVLFIGEYYFRQWRFPDQHDSGFIEHVKIVIAAQIQGYAHKRKSNTFDP
jgi:uncharacterized membrane protein